MFYQAERTKSDDMAIVKHSDRSCGYTQIGNGYIRDKRLSFKAKGLLTLLLSLPPGWNVTLRGLKIISKDSISSISAGMDELINTGYVRRIQTRLERGKLGRNELEVFDSPCTENPYTEKPYTENRRQLNKDKINKEKVIKEEKRPLSRAEIEYLKYNPEIMEAE